MKYQRILFRYFILHRIDLFEWNRTTITWKSNNQICCEFCWFGSLFRSKHYVISIQHIFIRWNARIERIRNEPV